MTVKHQYMLFPNGRDKAVTFSYDDGSHGDKRLSEIFYKNGLKCTFNICGNKISDKDNSYHLSLNEINKYIYGQGHEVAVHFDNHRAPGVSSATVGIREVLNCRLTLERLTGKIIRGAAYPNTGINKLAHGMTVERIENYLKDLGIAYARTIRGNGNMDLPNDWYQWVPTSHHANPELDGYIDEFLELDQSTIYYPSCQPRLLYIWGHSHELKSEDDWSKMERLCEKLAGHDEIWYATNIEIYEYVEAYRSLVFSADESMVYNPTLFEIWFNMNEKVYSIKPGETLSFE